MYISIGELISTQEITFVDSNIIKIIVKQQISDTLHAYEAKGMTPQD